MSILFTTKSENNPIRKGDAENILQNHDIQLRDEDSDDFCDLLAAVHELGEYVVSLPDYQPVPDLGRFPRENISRPLPGTNVYGNAWAHKFLIRGDGDQLNHLKICLKDNISVAGVPMMYGTTAIDPYTPSTDATVVTRLLRAGADIVGTTLCENFCHSTSSYTSGYGVVENPHAPGYSAGGSTSGGAALVGGRMVDAAIGADQGGSIRIPAAFCGCVGFKPTHGLVPYTGLLSGDAVIDHAGPITNSVYDAALILDTISGYDGIDDRSLGAKAPGSFRFAEAVRAIDGDKEPLKGYSIGLIRESFESPLLESSVKDCVSAAALLFQTLGAKVKYVSVPFHREGPAIWSVQQRIAGSQNLLGRQHGRHGLYLTEFEQKRLPWTTESFNKLFPSTQNVIVNGIYLSDHFPGLYGKTMNLARQLRDTYEEVLKDFDVLITPTVNKVAPPHGAWGRPIEAMKPSMSITANTCGLNITGQPALALPVGFSSPPGGDESVRLPISMQIIGGMWQDEKVLKVAKAWESNFNGGNVRKSKI